MRIKPKPMFLLLAAGLITASMVRLGFWQLDRAKSKSLILTQQQQRAQQTPRNLLSLLDRLETSANLESARFTPVFVEARARPEATVLVDNQVHKGQVGYLVYTPYDVGQGLNVLVNRGWVPVGPSRAALPIIETSTAMIELTGRLNFPAAKPPLWNDDYAVAQGPVWAYLPVAIYEQQFGLNVLPLVLELAPESAGTQFKVAWAQIDDEWVAKHQGYAFQWFAMALAFSVACLIVLLRRRSTES